MDGSKSFSSGTLREQTRRFQAKCVVATLRRMEGSCEEAAATLGIHRNTLARVLRNGNLPSGWAVRRHLRAKRKLPRGKPSGAEQPRDKSC